MTRLVLLDNEAAQALRDSSHPKHRKVISHVQIVADRKRRAQAISVAVPTAVRVEAGWDRASADWAFANRLRIADIPLDTSHASSAATIPRCCEVSVADAHLGAVMRLTSAAEVTVLTSDPRDMRKVARNSNVVIVAI